MPPKRQADGPFYSPRANANKHRHEYGSFKEALLETAWIGYWDEKCEDYCGARWSLPPDSPFRKAFGEGMLSYDTLRTQRPGRVRTFESKEGRTPSAKTVSFWKMKDKKTQGRRDDITLVPVPFGENLWCWAYRFSEVVNEQREDLFALLSQEKGKSNLEGHPHEKYSYLLRHEEPRHTGYSEDNFLFIQTTTVTKKKGAGGDTPPGAVHAQSLPGATSNVPQTPHAGKLSDDADLEEMVDDFGCMPVQEPEYDSLIDAGTTSTPREFSVPSASYIPQQRSELKPLQNGHSCTCHQSTDAQEEENMSTAAALLDRFQPHTNPARTNGARLHNGRIDGIHNHQKRRRENGEDSAHDTQAMPPPPPQKQPKTTGSRSCGTDASPRESMQCKNGSSGDGYENAPTLHTPSPRIRSPKDRSLKRITFSGDSSGRKTKATQASKEVSPAYSSHQRQDSPMQRSPSEFYESASNVAPVSEKAPLPIRTSPAVAPMTPSVSPQSSVGFDVNRALFKLVVADGNSREYGMRFHGCDTVQELFERVAKRVEDELGPGDVLRKLIFYADIFVPERCRPEVDVPKDDEPSFSGVLSRIKKTLEVVEDQVEMVVEVFVTRNT